MIAWKAKDFGFDFQFSYSHNFLIGKYRSLNNDYWIDKYDQIRDIFQLQSKVHL